MKRSFGSFIRSSVKDKAPKLYESLKRGRLAVSPLPFGLLIINFIFQRILRINGDVPWMVHFTSKVTGPERIEIGKDVWISFASSGGCYIQGGRNPIKIGDDTIFAPGIKIISANHDHKDFNLQIEAESIEIGKHCWIGANAVILPGVKLGDRAIVGAGAVVTKSFPEDALLVGVPARNIAKEG